MHPFLLALLLVAAPAARTTPAPAARIGDAALTSLVRARLDSLSRADAFSGAVLVARGGHVLLREARGFADRERRIANRPETRFNLGSINKIFTRLAIEQLAAAGKLSLGDTIARYLPDYPADKGRRITIEQLLEHRAGTGDIFNRRFRSMDVSRLRSIADWMDLIRDQPLDFDPGTREEYSNAGYVLLGAIIERVSGMSYYDYVRARIYAPAGMTASDSYAKDEAMSGRAIGYTRGFLDGAAHELRANTAELPGRGSSAGGGESTVDDLRRFADALGSGSLGVPSTGHGLGIAGGSPGVNAALETTRDYTIVVLANVDPPAAEDLAAEIRGWIVPAGASQRRRIVRAGGADAGDAEPGVVRRVIHAGGPDDPARKPGQTRIPAAPVEVPMGRSGHLPVVSVMVNGQGPFRFGIDTGGAGLARIDSALAARLGLERVGEVRAGDPSGRNTRIMPVVAVDSIEIGGARFARLIAPVRSYDEPRRGEPVDGILGFGLFAECLLTLDYPANRVVIARGELPAADGREIIDFTQEHGIPQVRLDVAGLDVAADVDAGAMGGFSLPESLASKLPLRSAPRVVGRARTVTNSFEIQAAELNGEVRLGAHRFANPTLEFQPIFPVANIGARVLEEFRVTFDQRNKRMRLERAGTTAEPAR